MAVVFRIRAHRTECPEATPGDCFVALDRDEAPTRETYLVTHDERVIPVTLSVVSAFAVSGAAVVEPPDSLPAPADAQYPPPRNGVEVRRPVLYRARRQRTHQKAL